MDNELMLLVGRIIDEEEEEFVRAIDAAMRVFAMVMMAIEENIDVDEIINAEASWQHVTVVIDDFHRFSDSVFKLHFRMNIVTFEALVEAVGNHLVEKNRMQVVRTPLRDVLLMVLWILATPDSFRSVALRFGRRPSTVYYFYAYVIEALREMVSNYISWPNAEERGIISDVFNRATGFPGIIGCIDCTHIYITAPVDDAVFYRNRHHSYSINVQAVVDHNLLIRDLVVGEPGSMNDNRIFRRSSLYTDILEDVDHRLRTPEQHIVGDGAYTLTDFMMIPFENNGHLTEAQLNFNIRLSQSRVRVENSFGRAKGKWRRLKFMHATNHANLIDHITASFVLHNFLIMNGEHILRLEELERPLNDREADENRQNEGDDEEDHPRMAGAKGRGLEKRIFIMENVLPARPVQD